jgi:hypothetical protein
MTDDFRVWRDETDPSRVNFTIPATIEFRDVWVNEPAIAACNAWMDAIERVCEAAMARTNGDASRIARREFEGEAWRTQIVIDDVPAYEIRGTWDEYRFSVATTEIL